MAGAVLGERQVSLFVVGAVLGEVQVSVSVVGAILGEAIGRRIGNDFV